VGRDAFSTTNPEEGDEEQVKENKPEPRKKSEHGQVVLLVALMFVPLCLMVGLAIDLGVLFYSKARLQRTVDAAALSAAESFYTPGGDPPTRRGVIRLHAGG
jgi:hypothetical protein